MFVLKESFSMELRPVAPFNFKLSVHKPAGWWWSTPNEFFQDETLWTAARLGGDLLGLKLHSVGTLLKPKLSCAIYSKNSLSDKEKGLITETLNRALKINEDLRDFYNMAEKDEILREVVHDLYGFRTTAWPELFPALILVLTLQMAPWKRSSEMMDLLIRNYGDDVNFDGKTVRYWPSPEKIAALTVEELRSKAKLGYRAQNLSSIAKELNEGFPSMEDLHMMDPEEAKKKLMTLRGIGEYSAELISPRPGFPLDVWSAKIFNILFFKKETDSPRGSIPALKKTAEKRWGKWRGHVFAYILNDLPKISERMGVDLTKF
jgi:DNA-3-methyladenine glycosylase II